MKKLLAIVLLLTPLISYAEKSDFYMAGGKVANKTYFSMGGGDGGDAEGANFSMEIGRVSAGKAHDSLWGFGLTFISNAGDVPENTFEYPIPHTGYRDFGIQQKGNELGLYGKYGKELGGSLFLTGSAGITMIEEVNLVRSNATGWYYENSNEDSMEFLYGLGLGFYPEEGKFGGQLDLDNRRGVTGSLVFLW